MNDESIPEKTSRMKLALWAPLDRASGSGMTFSAIASWLVPATLVIALGMSNGGYGLYARSAAGIVVWFIVGVACLVSVRSISRLSRASKATLVLLAAFAAWTAASMLWTENQEHTAIESTRVLSFLGVFALANLLIGRHNARQMLAGVTFGLTALVAIALFSRMELNLFPEQTAAQFIPVPEVERRLAYPLNYSGGIATLVTMTLPLLLGFAHSARTKFFRGLSAACLPMALVALWLTGSGLIVAVSWIGIVVFIAFSSDRLPKLGTVILGLLGGATLSFIESQMSALDRGLPTREALTQGDQLLAITLVVMVLVGAAHLGLSAYATRHGRPGWTQSSRRRRRGLLAVGVGAVVVVCAMAFAGTFDSQLDRFRSLSNVPTDASRISQISDIGSSGRYQQWQSALDESAAHPIGGTGAGTFEFWWSRNATYSGYVKDAHSLYLETLGELGFIGFALLVALMLSILAVGVRRTLDASVEDRSLRAAGLAGCFAFAAAAGLDWMWELGVLPIAFLMLAAVAVSPWGANGVRDPSVEPGPGPGRVAIPSRLALVGLSVVAIVAIGIPYLTAKRLDGSEAHFRDGDYVAAYDSADSAASLEPFAASPRLQQALVLERTGQIDDAIVAAEAAVERAPTDWRPLVILSRLQAAAGDDPASQSSYDEAMSLNPKSTYFTQ